MRVNWLIALLGCIILTATAGSSQDSTDKPILPAPTSTGRAAPRNRGTTPKPEKNTNRIVGGEQSAGRPFMAALFYEKDKKLYQYCGASVIGDRWLLTAAHCEVQKGDLTIINRSYLQGKGGVSLTVEQVYTHQQYDPKTYNNDISLLKLSGDISAAIPRISVAAPPAAATRVLTAGWGLTKENGQPSLKLREVKVPIITNNDCKASYSDLTNNMICAGEKGKDSCQGDSGGPLFLDSSNDVRQIGIVSHGVGCGRDGFPGVYTQVDHYQEWIITTMGP